MDEFGEDFQTEIIDENCNVLSNKLAAINNEVRFTILKILRDFGKIQGNKNKDPLYSREINVFLTNFNINITPQMLGQHLKILVNAGILEEVFVKKEIPNKIGRRNVKAYVIRSDAFSDLFLDINFFSDELLSFFELYDINKNFHDEDDCIITVFNGKDKGKTFKISKNDQALIGRKSKYNDNDFDGFETIMLDNSYYSVSNISKPHIRLFHENGDWQIIDEDSSNGTFIGDKRMPSGVNVILKNNSFLKLSRGGGSAVIYCSF